MTREDKKTGMFSPRSGMSDNYTGSTEPSRTSDLLPTFGRSRTINHISDFDSDTFCTTLGSTVIAASAAYFANMCLAALDRGFQKGNMKDIKTEQQTGFVTLCNSWAQVLLTLAPMKQIKTLFKSAPESNAVTALGDGNTGNTNVANYTFLTWNSMLSELTGKFIPDMVIKSIKNLFFVIKFHDGYRRYSVDLPPAYLMPIAPKLVSTDVDTLIDLIFANQGLAQRHMDKFGVKYSKFDPAMLDFKVIAPDDPDAIALFTHGTIGVRAAAANVENRPNGDLDGGNHTARYYYFKESPNESALHYLLPIWMTTYDATENKYGGLVNGIIWTTTQNDLAGFVAQEHESSEFLAVGVDARDYIVSCFQNMYDNSAALGMSITGTTLTADKDLTNNLYFSKLGLAKGAGLSRHIIENAALRYLMEIGLGG